jgi:large subunit ribosomal protein L21
MRYAVFQTGGKQYKVSEGQTLEVEKLKGAAEEAVKFDEILFYADEKDFSIGMPHLSGAVVKGKILEQKKGKKIRVSKFKAKARTRRVTGHRQLLTKVLIEKITVGGKSGSGLNRSEEIKNQKANIKKTAKK